MQLQNLQTKFLGKNIIYYKTIDSTQSEIWKKIEENNIENGTIILADIQTQGKRYTWKKMVYRRKRKYRIFILYRKQL